MGRGIATLFHDRGTRRGWVVSSTLRPHFTSGKDPVPIVQEAGWAPGPVWTGGKSRPHRDSIPDRPARSQSLYRLGYPTHCFFLIANRTYFLDTLRIFTRFLQTVPESCSDSAHEIKYSHWVTNNPLLRDYTDGNNKYVKLLYLFYTWSIRNKKYCELHMKLVCSWITTFSIWDSQLTVGCSATDSFPVLVFLGCNSNYYLILKFMAIPWHTLQNRPKIKQVLLMRIFALM